MQQYDSTPTIKFSNPEDGEHPALIRFTDLNERIEYDLPIRDKDSVSRLYRVVELPRTDSNEFFVHVYNTTQISLRLRYFGYSQGGEVEPLSGSAVTRAALYRQHITLADGFDGYLLRIDLGIDGEGDERKFDDLDTISVAAYAGREPQSPGGIKIEGKNQESGGARYLPFSHNGRSFQRLVISTCDPEEDIRELAKATGLEMAETYFGKLGSVIAIGVPPGMSLNNGRDATHTIRQKGHSGEGTVEEDYILNLFAPKKPIRKGEKPLSSDRATPDGLTEFRPPHSTQFDGRRKPLTLALIDSGIDYGRNNAHLWTSTRYTSGPNTEFLTPGRYGYDFIRRQEEPIDEAPHGTHVAATVLNQYTATRPLQLLHLKVFGQEGIASYFGSLVSIYEATVAGAEVINMSWGFYQESEPRALYCALKTAAKNGVLMVTSAGNDKEDLDKVPQWPAAFADDFPCNLITVGSYAYNSSQAGGAIEANLVRADYSNFGRREVTLAAFLTSPVPEFGTGTVHFPVGTSISAPIVAGLLANWLADNPNGTLSEFRKTYYHPTKELETVVTNGHYIRHDNAPRRV
ncbi:S8 family peptidase [Lewinella sp. IMCC34191]|uniref:S8 family peptidase n=1 Tax=Lewinella sp. IMCC34191 TaxID=2259172 RepID=UPI000E246D3A|nr:S8 family serine peptidase [Lewinella sp. IMCC34191]